MVSRSRRRAGPRALCPTIKPAGHKALKRRPSQPRELNEAMLAPLSPAEGRQLRELLISAHTHHQVNTV
jgi:hypothetical protein